MIGGFYLFILSAAVTVIYPSLQLHVPQRVNLTRPENDSEFWLNGAQQFVEKQRQTTARSNVAKNLIMFVGGGMSMTTLAATRPYVGSEETELAFDAFPGVGMLKTYCVDQQVADSACSGAALLTGVKANLGTIGMSAKVKRSDCVAHLDPTSSVTSIAEWAMESGKVVGFVTTGRVTGSSTANLYAHSADRTWENDVEVKQSQCNPVSVTDIARQLVLGEVGSKIRVILGGGRREFRDRTQVDETNVIGTRGDGRDLVREWQASKSGLNANYVWNRAQFNDINRTNTDYLFGLFAPNHLHSNLKMIQDKLYDSQPSLDEMVAKAISILSKNEAGYFLFVENGNINDAHQLNQARVALDETAELSKAVEMAKQMSNVDDTLLVVTADHSHTLTYSGYPVRFNDIFGIADYGTWVGDSMPIMTLSYALGAGSVNNMKPDGVRERFDPTTLDTSPIDFAFPATVPAVNGVHGGDDVAVYASGPWAHLFGGNVEQSVVPHLMAFASCLGNGTRLTACGEPL